MPNTADFGWPKGYLLALADQEKSSMMTPQGRPPQEAGRQGGRLSLHPLLKKIPQRPTLLRRATSRIARYMSRSLFWDIKQDIFTKVLLLTYSSVEGWPPCGRCAVRTPSGPGPPVEGFFPRLETSISKSSRVPLFFPWGEGISDSPPRSPSFVEALIPPVWMCNI